MQAKVRGWGLPLGLGVMAWVAIMATRSDPGLTSDEPFNVFYGKEFVRGFLRLGRDFFKPDAIQAVMGTPEAQQHPPLGRWLIGWVHWLQNQSDQAGWSIPDARAAPATLYALTVILVSHAAGMRYGAVAGLVSGVSLLLMPRVFAHGHFAALDTIVSAAYLAGVLSAAWMMEGARPWLRAPLAGLVLGAALLTKMHGFFLIPLVAVWAILAYRWGALLPLFGWLVTGVAVFFAGWPWLWYDTATRLSMFLSTGLERSPIYVWYMGTVMQDREVPWHYPWVLFLVTVPVGLHALGFWGLRHQLWRGRNDRTGLLLLGAALFPLLVFSIPHVPVYDGVRLFLMAFPAWALLVGQGAALVYSQLESRWRAAGAGVATGLFIACQGYGVVHYHPFQLSYYNCLLSDGLRHPLEWLRGPVRIQRVLELTSGLRGADALGFEVTYWGDAVTPGLIARWSELAPENSCAVLVPALHRVQAMMYETGALTRRGQSIRIALESPCAYLIVYNRKAYLSDEEVRAILRDQTPLAQLHLDGVWLSAIYTRRPPKPVSPERTNQTPGR